MDPRQSSREPHANGQAAYSQQTRAPAYGQYDGRPAQPAMSATLDRVPLGTDEENSGLLDLIDRLRECRVDQFIDLPQVVAVGDQSSGKSSVLEAITQIPFPRASIACTRFATQIRLRRDTSLHETITKVSIIPNKPGDRAKFEQFAHTVDTTSDFGDIFQRASDLIFHGNPNFLSRDILSIERTGPNLPHLTIVDLPGIIHNPTKHQTVADVEAISALSKFYMTKDRTIILPIVGCDSEYARQVIVRRCKEADPKGIRTLGVITKPDMTLTAEREAEFLDLACNRDERNRLELGWHVLKNRAHNEMDYSTDKRDEEEKRYFANSRWGAELEPSQLGVEALRKKLSTQLIRHIANEVFKVQGDIERQLHQVQGKLKEMGPGLETIQQMRQELQNLCKRSGSLTREAVQGHGINPLGEDFFPRFNDKTKKFARNLRSRVVIMNEAFNDNMENYGSLYVISNDGSHPSQPSPSTSKASTTNVPPGISRKEFIEREVQPLIRDNPGQELSVDINPRLVYRLFQSYSTKWATLAERHVEVVEGLCEEFLTEVLGYAWPSRLRSRVWRGFVQKSMQERYRHAILELEGLKKDRYRNIRTYHSSFEKKYYAQRSEVKGSAESASPLNKFEDTLNKMLLHYEHQLPTFTSNIITQVIERHLIDGMEEIFEGDRVHKLSDAQVRQLMEEDSVTAKKRKELREQESVLESGMDICRDIAGRNDLGPYERQDPSLHGYDDVTSSKAARLNPFDEPESPAPGLPVRNPFDQSGSTSKGRKPVTWDAPASETNGYDAVEQTATASRNRNSGGTADTPASVDELDEDAQLQRAIEESKREEAARQASRYPVQQNPALPTRPAADDQESINTGRTRRRGLFGRG